MGTRSLITIKTEENVHKTIYCHWDGYVEGVGMTLIDHYNEQSKIEELISLGDISSLRENISPSSSTFNVKRNWETGEETPTSKEHSFESPHENVTVFYGRDRGETNIEARVNKKYPKHIDCGQDYEYLFRDGKWLYKPWRGKRFRDLEKAVAKFKLEEEGS
jgi:hypothetical protein